MPSSSTAGRDPASPEEPDVTPLTEPSEGVPTVVDTAEGLAAVISAFASGSGPVAVDAERASGYRYGQRTYLVQLRRAGAGTALVDPVPLPDLSALSRALSGTEWVLHAASQDLPGLAEQGLRPDAVFDTELAARLLGMERVGLAAVVAEVLGLGLAKEHSAVDWSTRPLPSEWLRYAALDVEVLVTLREELAERLEKAGKSEWARQEFEAVRTAAPPPPRVDPWRRLSGLHTLRDARRVAVARELWLLRDAEARRRDLSPGRVLPDAAIIAAAELDPKDERTLLTLPGFGGRSVRRLARTWIEALTKARELPDDMLPVAPPLDGPPPPHRWAERDPVAAARLARCREVVTTAAAAHTLPPENLITPDSVRRLAWTPPEEITPETVAATLRGYGARAWQVGLIAEGLAAALREPTP